MSNTNTKHRDWSKLKRAPQIHDETELKSTIVCNQRSYEVPQDVADELKALQARNERLEKALQELVDAVTAEVNEKGAGGYLLARLTDAKAVLEEVRQSPAPSPSAQS